MHWDEKLFDEEKIVREFTYLHDRECAGEGCEAVVTVRRTYESVKFQECRKLLYE